MRPPPKRRLTLGHQDAAHADAADYAAGTHLTTVTVTISDGGTDTHVITLPNLYLLTCEPQRPLNDINRLRVTASSLSAGSMTWQLPTT